MKKCPFCAEEIQDEAIVCRYCGRDLTQVKIQQEEIKPKEQSSKNEKASNVIWGIIITLIILGIGAYFYIIRDRFTGSSFRSDAATPTREYCNTQDVLEFSRESAPLNDKVENLLTEASISTSASDYAVHKASLESIQADFRAIDYPPCLSKVAGNYNRFMELTHEGFEAASLGNFVTGEKKATDAILYLKNATTEMKIINACLPNCTP